MTGYTCGGPYRLSHQDQDKIFDKNDEPTACRIIRLLPPVDASSTELVDNTSELSLQANPMIITRLFEDDDLQELWERGVTSDKDWQRARDALSTGERSFPPNL